MKTYAKTQVTKNYRKMFGKEETIANYEALKVALYPLYQSEIDRRIKRLSK